MNLHQDKNAFEALILDIGQRTGIRGDIIEKDYYLTLLLWELSRHQQNLPAYFNEGLENTHRTEQSMQQMY